MDTSIRIVTLLVAVIAAIIAYKNYKKKAQVNKTNQKIIGKGDNVQGDKIYGDKISGNKVVNNFNSDKKEN